MANTRKKIPKELENIAYSEDVNALQEQVDRCYSEQRYEAFQNAVEKIIGRYNKTVFGWAILLWLITLIASMLLQKFFNVF